jgi:hypothetical protein
MQHSDRQVAGRVKLEWERLGLSVFLDLEGIEAGDDFPVVLDKEIKSALSVVAIWSNYALTRDWLRKECRVAKQRKVLVPLAIEEIDHLAVPVEFDGVQWIEFDKESEAQLEGLVRSLARTLKRKELIHEYAKSVSSASVRPLVLESTTVESTNVRVVLDDYSRGRIQIPDYQRDSDQWSFATKSLFVETVINNLAVPAFFFEPRLESGRKVDEVVDGQQRLTTLAEFYAGNLRLVSCDDAPYISTNAAHYAGRCFDELPQSYRDSFEAYRLPIIKLHNLGDMRLEVFRRINQGGTALRA